MGDGFKWIFELFDKFSSPANAMTSALKRFGDAIMGSSRSFGRFVSGLDHGLNIIDRVGRGLERLGRIAFGGIDFAVQAAMFKENTVMGFEMILGSKEKANQLMKDIVSLAANTPFRTHDIAEFTRNFVMSGFGPNDALKLTQGVADMGAARGMDSEKMRMLAFWMDQVKSSGHLSQRALYRIESDQLIGTSFIDEAFKKHGLLSPIQGGGPVDAVTGLQILLDAIMAQTHEKRVGEYSQRAGRELLSGAFSTLMSRPEELLMNLDESKGFDQLKKFVSGLAEYLKPGGEIGNMLTDAATSLFNGMAEALFGPIDKTETLDKVKDAIKSFATYMKSVDWHSVFDQMKDAAHGLFVVLESLAYVLEKIGKGYDWIQKTFGQKGMDEANRSAFVGYASAGINELPPYLIRGLGENVSSGFAQGIWQGQDRIEDAIKGTMVYPTIDTTKSEFQVHSPSKVMERIGRQVSEGFELGLQGPGGLASSLQDALPSSAAISAGAGGRLTVPIHIHASDSIAEKVKDLVVSALSGAFEEVSIEMAVA